MRRLLATALAVAVAAPAAAQEGPPPTPVPPFGSPSPFPSVLETPRPRDRPPKVDAAAVALADLESGRILYARRGRQRRPIASVTKIMTALLVLEEARPFDVVTVSARAAAEGGAELGLRAGERVEIRELVFALMLQSANDAAVALAEHVGGTVGRFVRRMNRRARELGADRTRFASPNGLDDAGRSTAEDLALITAHAFRTDPFGEIVGTRRHTVPAPRGPDRRIQNRNALLWLYPGAIGVKTGFTSAAGFCLVAAAERDGMPLVAVALGSPDEAFSDAAALLDHGFHAYERKTLVEEGQPVGRIRVAGRPVPVAAGGAASAVLRPGAEVGHELSAAPGLRLPVRVGAELGQLVLVADGREVGRVPVVAVRAVAAVPPRPPPWWVRLAGAAVELLVRLLLLPEDRMATGG
ncbi:MAG TPA: D-alanyl-D-alanine carboxypeptidase family protein [Actinomycetota bacterium]